MIKTDAIHDRFVIVAPHLDERGRRSFAAAEARSAGYGGIAAVARATGLARSRRTSIGLAARVVGAKR
jgi:hypothetical protein